MSNWNDESDDVLDDLTRRLEESWRTTAGADIASLVPPDGHVLRRSALLILIQADQELRWQHGQPKTVEQYLVEWPELRDDPRGLAELAQAEQCLSTPLAPCEIGARGEGSSSPLAPGGRGAAGEGSSSPLAPGGRGAVGEGGVHRIAHFELHELLGEGSVGSVWKARDTELDRVVAVKIPRRGQIQRDDTARFLREAKAAAGLHHPNIVTVYEVGMEGDTPYIVSEFIEGRPLDKWLVAQGQRPTVGESVELCITIAAALEYAHQSGVIHRDLKPANVMMDAAGQPHIMDFGLAKREAAEITMTLQGQILGTPAYMSPEQARGEGHVADGRTDVYSLGVILFELLTGERPFRGDVRMLLQQVIDDESPSLRKLDGRLPRDLETACAKCLENSADRRYAGAADLADDLRHFLAGEPIHARPVGKAERCWRWCRRNRLIASLSAAVAALLLSVTAVAVIGYVGTNRALRRETGAYEAVDAERQKTADALQRERQTVEALQRTLYVSTVRLADQEWDRGNVSTARSLLDQCPKALRGWEWDRLQYACHFGECGFALPTEVNWIDCSPDETEFVVGSGTSGKISIWDAATRKKKLTLADGQYGASSRVLWNPTGTLVAAATTKGAIVFSATSSREICRVDGSGPGSKSDLLAWSPDGRRLATVVDYSVLMVWNAATGDKVSSFDKGVGGITCIAWSPDSKLVGISSHSGIIQVYDPDGARLVSVFSGAPQKATTAVCWSHDARILASSGYDDVIRVWKLGADGKAAVIKELRGHAAPVWALAFSPRGDRLASNGDDRLLKIWDLATGAAQATIRGDLWRPESLRWSPDQKWLLCAEGGKLKRFPTDAADNAVILPGSVTSRTLSWRSDNRHLATNRRETCEVWDTRSKEMVFRVRAHQAGEFWQPSVQAVAYSHDGKFLATAGRDELTKIWDAESRSEIKNLRALVAEEDRGIRRPQTHFELKTLRGHAGTVHCVDWSPDDTRLVTSGADGSVRVWDAAAGKELHTLVKSDRPIQCVAWSPDGRFIASGGDDKIVGLWDAGSRQLVFSLTGHPGPITSLAWSPDGNRLVSAGPGAFKIWNTATGVLERDLPTPTGARPVCAWSPDGRRLAVGGKASCTWILDSMTGDELLSLRGHAASVRAVAWSPNGKSLASADELGHLKIWETENIFPRQTSADSGLYW